MKFSVYGPDGTIPWVATIGNFAMLMWARTQPEAEGYVRVFHKTEKFRLFKPTNPNHHLGTKRVVGLEGPLGE